MHRVAAIAAMFLVAVCKLACAQNPELQESPTSPPVDTTAYPWLPGAESSGLPEIAPLTALYQPPPGCRRVDASEGSFALWLRGLPVLTKRALVHDYRGRPIPALADRVILLDVGERDLQQCADTLIRLHAEYLWATGQAAQAGYHFTSGDFSSWADWQAGIRLEVAGRHVSRRPGAARARGHASYRAWLQSLFVYAGTMSLRLDSAPVGIGLELTGGDFFVEPGSPGHAVIILDVAQAQDGTRFALIGQGFTPAQELHVLSGTSAVDGVWFELPRVADGVLRVPSWSPFPRSCARRFTIRGSEQGGPERLDQPH